MGFAENFIAGYHTGAQSKREKEQLALQKETLAQHQQEHANELKLRQQESDAMIQAHTLDEKLKLLAFQRTQPTPQQPIPTTPGGGPPAPVEEAPVSLDIAGQHFNVPIVHSEQAQHEALDQAQALANIKSDVRDVILANDIPGIGKKGEKVSPEELTARGHALTARSVVEASRNRADASLQKGWKNQVNADGENTGIQFNAATGEKRFVEGLEGTRDKAVGGLIASRGVAAQAALASTATIKGLLQRPGVKAALGPFAGRETSLQQLIPELMGSPDPDVQKLAGALHGYALNTMGVHGMRSAVEAEHLIEQHLGNRFTPEGIAAGLDGLNEVPNFYASKVGGGKPKTAEDYLAKIGGQ